MPRRPICVLFGYDHFGCVGLDALQKAGAYVPLVFTHADAPGVNTWWPSLERYAARLGIPVICDADLSPDSPAVERLKAIAPDYLLSCSFGTLLGDHILDIPRRSSYNLHHSLLPSYRGRCPLNWQLIHGELKSGLTLHRMVRRAAAGEIIAQQEISIAPDQDIYGLTNQLLDVAPDFLENALQLIFTERARTRLPDLSSSTFVRNRLEADGFIDWNQSATHIYNVIRAEAPPWPGAIAFLQGERCWLNYAEVRDARGKFGPPGLVLADGTVACGRGRIAPTGLFSVWANPIRPTPGTQFDLLEEVPKTDTFVRQPQT